MPSFDIVSQYDQQEVKNAVDQTEREITNRFDFKGTNSEVELNEDSIRIESSTEDRLNALLVVLEEKLVKRKVSLKTLLWQDPEAASGGRVRKVAKLQSGIGNEDSKSINRQIKDLGIKGIQSQNQGDQIRVSGKKRDALQEVIASLKSSNIELPLQFINFRD
ncbi:MAG: YajQ family cyclic di-GMP-binding protein [Actinobacteria bacterium]|nr:YajQ family cyclic di-GMP-binding protein [Actinomycetota bacterium]|tara:strand:- start:825 stop:1313 length:489 start_codon:yes stop_codon:yes gene_type:complete